MGAFKISRGRPVAVVVPPGSYPLGVLAVDAANGNRVLRDAWDYAYGAPGARVARGAMTTVAALSLPSGCTRTTGATGTGLTVSTSNALSAIDFTASALFVLNNGNTSSFTDCGLFGGAANTRFWSGQDTNGNPQGAPTTTLSYFTANLAGGEVGDHGPLSSFGHPLTVDHFKIYNAPRNVLNSGGTVTFSDGIFGAFATTFVFQDHTEPVRWTGGVLNVLRVVFDPLVGGLPALSGITGAMLVGSAASNPTTATIDSCIFANQRASASYTLTLKAENANSTTTIRNTAIDPGVFGYQTLGADPGFTCRMIDGGNNFDLYTGAPLNFNQTVVG